MEGMLTCWKINILWFTWADDFWNFLKKKHDNDDDDDDEGDDDDVFL